jgi:hypothetical protein
MRTQLGFASHPHRHARGREAGPAERNVLATDHHAVLPATSDRRRDSERAVLGLLEMPSVGHVGRDERWLEQTWIQIAHHLHGADRRQIGRPLVPSLGAERVAEGEQHRRASEHNTDDRKHHQRGLAGLSARGGGSPADGTPPVGTGLDHAARPWSHARYASTHACAATRWGKAACPLAAALLALPRAQLAAALEVAVAVVFPGRRAEDPLERLSP